VQFRVFRGKKQMKRLPKILPIICMLVIVGCGKRLPPPPDGMPPIVPCVVEVRFGGQAIEDVTILFQPKNTTDQWSAGGTTDAKGKAVMKTGGYYSGVVPGEYAVSFRKVDHVELDRQGMPMRSHSAIPVKYTDKHSKETITVTEKQSIYVFELEGISDTP